MPPGETRDSWLTIWAVTQSTPACRERLGDGLGDGELVVDPLGDGLGLVDELELVVGLGLVDELGL